MTSAMSSEKDATECVDYMFWSQMSGWTVEEAAALLLDINPDRLPKKSDKADSPGWKYQRLFRLLDRACEMDELSSPMTPREFLTWASSNKLKPPELLEKTVRAGKPHRNWRTRYRAVKAERDELRHELEELKNKVVDELNPRARQTLLKLVGGIARAKLKHSTGNRNTVSLIEKALDELNWPLSANSIRSYLNEADALYDQAFPKRT